ncbi:MAG: 30S ribosome-binding factor RbfA [Candidatus Hydrogenedentota bacterium]|nr:MAG: 30S ribosome-binding factor RbfA [Candidatus Hydrogenedentota bacterium]
MNEIRKKRIEKRILILLNELYYRELKDKDLGFCTFLKVELNKDGTVAKVYVSLFGEPKETRKSYFALKRASKFIASRISKALRLRVTPRIDFIIDTSLDNIEKIDKILDEQRISAKRGDSENLDSK